MQHFFYGLNPESAHFMNVASEGSVMYKTVAEDRTLLEKVLNSTDYTGIYDDPPEPIEQPSETQQLQILSATSSPPPPYIEEITEPPKSSDHEPFYRRHAYVRTQSLHRGRVLGTQQCCKHTEGT